MYIYNTTQKPVNHKKGRNLTVSVPTLLWWTCRSRAAHSRSSFYILLRILLSPTTTTSGQQKKREKKFITIIESTSWLHCSPAACCCCCRRSKRQRSAPETGAPPLYHHIYYCVTHSVYTHTHIYPPVAWAKEREKKRWRKKKRGPGGRPHFAVSQSSAGYHPHRMLSHLSRSRSLKCLFFLSQWCDSLYMDYQHDICGKFRIDPYYKDFFVCLVEWHLHFDLIFGIQPEGDI